MIAVDTSAIVAVLWQEAGSDRLRTRLAAAGGAVISTGSVLELQLVLAGVRATGNWDQVEALFNAYGIVVRPFDDVQLRIAREAAIRFGKGRHKAALNFAASERAATRRPSISAIALRTRSRDPKG